MPRNITQGPTIIDFIKTLKRIRYSCRLAESLLVARWFISKTQKWVQHLSIAWRAFKAARRFLENFQKLEDSGKLL